jgi:hypothetical protein
MPLASLRLPVINFATDFGDTTLQINDDERCITGHTFFFRSWIADWGGGNPRVMFSLIYGLWKQVFSKTEFHVLILGVHKAGKTVILSEASICILSLAACVPPVHGLESSLY